MVKKKLVEGVRKIKISRFTKQKKKRIWFDEYMLKAGYDFTEKNIVYFITFFSLCISLIFPIFYILSSELIKEGAFFIMWSFTWLSLVAFPTTYLILTLLFFIVTDLRISSRKHNIEKVFPEFLHLTAANIRAGMPIDQALWSAVRPKFGILSREIELVAKRNMTGEELTKVLDDFSKKYDSKILRRTISLIVEGINAGSEIGDLLENVALSIEDIQTRKDSMAANVTSNIIFISFSTLVAAPALFAISIQLLKVVHIISSSFNFESFDGIVKVNFALSADAVKQSDFMVFCYLSLILSSIMANIIIATIKTGRIVDAIKKIPYSIVISLIVFFIAQWLLGYIFAGMF